MSHLLYTVGPLFLFLCVVYFVIERTSQTRKLAAIPTMGQPGLLGSYWDAITHFSRNDKLVMQGYNKYKGSLFKISLPNTWNVVVASPDLLDDLSRAPETELSFFFGFAEVPPISRCTLIKIPDMHDYLFFQAFTSEMVKGLHTKDHKSAGFHIQAIQHGLTRSAESKFPELLDELGAFFDEICPPNGSDGKFKWHILVPSFFDQS
jgi:hypothetical protein